MNLTELDKQKILKIQKDIKMLKRKLKRFEKEMFGNPIVNEVKFILKKENKIK